MEELYKYYVTSFLFIEIVNPYILLPFKHIESEELSAQVGFFVRFIFYLILNRILWRSGTFTYWFSGWAPRVWENGLTLSGLEKPHFIFEAEKLPWWVGRNRTEHAKYFQYFFVEQGTNTIMPVQFLAIFITYFTTAWWDGPFWIHKDDWVGFWTPHETWLRMGTFDEELAPIEDWTAIWFMIDYFFWYEPTPYMKRYYAYTWAELKEEFDQEHWYKVLWVSLFLGFFPRYRRLAWGRAFAWPYFFLKYQQRFQETSWWDYAYFVPMFLFFVTNIDKVIFLAYSSAEDPEAEWERMSVEALEGPTGWQERAARNEWAYGDPGYRATVWEELGIENVVPQIIQDYVFVDDLQHGEWTDEEGPPFKIWYNAYRLRMGYWTPEEEANYLSMNPFGEKRYWD